MESSSNRFILKVSRLFPSSFASCHFRTLPDVADSSIAGSKAHKPHHQDNGFSSSALPKLCNGSPLLGHSTTKSPTKQTGKLLDTMWKRASNVVQSSSSYSGWFSSSDDKARPENDDVGSDTFFSLSSNSGGDSSRLKTSRRFCDEMKSIDEKGNRSFSSVNSSNTVLTKCNRKGTEKAPEKKPGKVCRENEPTSDQISTDQLYYTKNGTFPDSSLRRRRSMKNRRRSKRAAPGRSLEGSWVMKESYAVEKRSRDPRGDFRASMVEMIVEKQMFGLEDLERLLLCFLSLNSATYHGVIIDVFTEICETLFRN